MLDHMILTVSSVERSLAFYEAALKPLKIKFFLLSLTRTLCAILRMSFPKADREAQAVCRPARVW